MGVKMRECELDELSELNELCELDEFRDPGNVRRILV